MLILFDIDATLVTVRDGIGRTVVAESFAATFGVDVQEHLQTYSFAGQTDRAIMHYLAASSGIHATTAEEGWEHYRAAVEQHMVQNVGPSDVAVLPGVMSVVQALAQDTTVTLALVTGNIRNVAFHKLAMGRLHHVFAHGAFGCEHANRSALPPLALQRVNTAYNTTYRADQCVVIGDAPNDVQCARDNGMRSIAVATGPVAAEALHAAGADVVMDSFADVEATLRVIASLRS